MKDKMVIEEIESDMYYSLYNENFKVFLQPKCDITTKEIIGAEALIRWVHPQKGTIEPDQFIPIFEKNEFIIRIDEYMWEKTCTILSHWLKMGIYNLPISVNVSRIHFKNINNSMHLIDNLIFLTKKYNVPLHLLHIEITESSFSENTEEVLRSLKELQKKGFIIAIDDFGTGYSSLSMLKKITADIIKLDKGFIDGNFNHRGQIIVKNIISMLREIDSDIIAEGVETQEQADFLLTAGCNTAQGYLYSKPVPVSVFENLITEKIPSR